MEVILRIDSREDHIKKKKVKNDVVRHIFDEMKEFIENDRSHRYSHINIKIEKMALQVGDYDILINDKVMHVIERKTMKDFCSSMIKGDEEGLHLHKMIRAQEETNCRLSFLLEHNQVFLKDDTPVGGKFSKIKFLQVDRKIDSLLVEYNISTFKTKDCQHTAKKLIDICYSYGLRYEKIKHIFGGGTEVLTTKIDRTLENMTTLAWRSIPGVGPETAQSFIKNVSLKEVICKEVDCDYLTTLETNQNKSIGKKGERVYNQIAGETNEVHVKILTTITGVSKIRADRLCKAYDIQFLCEEKNISEIAKFKVGKTSLGEKVANRIYNVLVFKLTL